MDWKREETRVWDGIKGHAEPREMRIWDEIKGHAERRVSNLRVRRWVSSIAAY